MPIEDDNLKQDYNTTAVYFCLNQEEKNYLEEMNFGNFRQYFF